MCGIFFLIDTNELTKQKETHRLKKMNLWLWGGGGTVRVFGKVMNTLLYSKWITKGPAVQARGTVLNVMCQPGWEWGLGENGYMYMYG